MTRTTSGKDHGVYFGLSHSKRLQNELYGCCCCCCLLSYRPVCNSSLVIWIDITDYDRVTFMCLYSKDKVTWCIGSSLVFALGSYKGNGDRYEYICVIIIIDYSVAGMRFGHVLKEYQDTCSPGPMLLTTRRPTTTQLTKWRMDSRHFSLFLVYRL